MEPDYAKMMDKKYAKTFFKTLQLKLLERQIAPDVIWENVANGTGLVGPDVVWTHPPENDKPPRIFDFDSVVTSVVKTGM